MSDDKTRTKESKSAGEKSAAPTGQISSGLFDSLPASPRLWTELGLDGEHGRFAPPLFQEQDSGIIIDPGDLYTRRDLTSGEQLCISLIKGRVLELGAGFGRVSHSLRELGLDVVTTDADPELVAMYRARGWQDACEVRLPDVPASLGKFDTIIALRGVLSMSGEIDQVHLSLQRNQQLLNPGGRLIFTSGNVNPVVTTPGRSPLEYNIRFIYRGNRSPWIKFTALPDWLAVPFLRGLGFITIETFVPQSPDGAGYYAFAQLGG